ncbi:MAG: glycosyltransferase family 4 protein [Phycisphaerales bacterium]|nr:glycosyltransferase family 4 protein [Phycisphaerales bacterium]
MHICHVITRLIIGGAQENTLLTCEGLVAQGYRVTLIAGPTRGAEGSLVPRARAGGYEYVELPSLMRAVNPWLDTRAYRDLIQEFQRLRPEIVHTHSSKAGILGRWAADRARVPRVVHTIHGMSFNRTQPRPVRTLYAWLERRAAARTHALVSVADALSTQMVAARVCEPGRLRTIYSGMEVGAFTPSAVRRAAARQRWGLTDEHVVVGTVARLFRRKGYEQLLSIMAQAAACEPRLRFVWVGDGAQRSEYEAELRRLGLNERTILTGLLCPTEVSDQVAGFDLLAHTSQWEGLPRVVVQALLMQVPAVAFDIDGTPEVVQDGQTGRLIPLNDLDAFAAALCELAADGGQRQRLGVAGRALCLERFDARRMVADLVRLYEGLMRS